MFNFKKHSEIIVPPTEKMLRKDNLGPSVSDENPASIVEKNLPHRTGVIETTTEHQMEDIRTSSDNQIIEKIFETAKGYVPHRNEATWLSTPPLPALVEKLRQDRLAKDWKPTKESNWTVSFNDKKQQGQLPKTEKNVGQHDRTVLNNDPERFSNLPDLTKPSASVEDVKPVVGNITTADLDWVSHQIKTGQSLDYDTAIVAILREADREQRELTDVEKKTVCQLKIARTNSDIHQGKP